MSIRIGASVSTLSDPFAAGAQAARAAAASLERTPADLAVVFASGAFLDAPEALLEGVHDVLEPRALIGCGAGGVLGEGRELESGTALAVWAATFDGVASARPFHATVDDVALEGEIEGLPLEGGIEGLPPGGKIEGLPLERSGERDGAPGGMILLSDPYSFPTDAALAQLGALAPSVPVLGGLASARTPLGSAALFLGEEVCEQGAVGVSLSGIEIVPCVSQGATPLGRELTITEAHDNIITELAGGPALETIEAVIGELDARELALVSAGLLIGIVVDTGRPEYEQGDFLVRGVLGADRDTGAVAVGTTVRPGQVIRLHARDAQSADADLRQALALRRNELAGQRPAGALLFSCSGRGRQMFGIGDHDASIVRDELQGAPAAGFFAAGEIGPIGGRSFLHGFTATVALFPDG